MAPLAHIDTRLAALLRVGESNGPSLARSWLGDGSTAYWTADGAEAHADSGAAHSIFVRVQIPDLATLKGLIFFGYSGSAKGIYFNVSESVYSNLGGSTINSPVTQGWRDIVVSVGASSQAIFVDGASVVSGGAPTSVDFDKLTLGGRRYDAVADLMWPGNIHEVALYDYPLTLADAQALHAAAGVSHAAALTLSGAGPLDDWLLGNAVDGGGGTYTCPSLGSRGITATSVGTISIVEDAP